MSSNLQPSRRRLLLAIKLAVAALVLAWFGRYAYLRITTPAADLQRAWADLAERLEIPREEGEDEDLAEAVAALPALPMFNPTPPAGVRWSFPFGRPQVLNLTDMIAGEWNPESRPYLQLGLEYLTDPATTAALEQVRKLRDRRWGSLGSRAPGLGGFNYMILRNPVWALIAHARYCHARLKDVEGAWEDLKTVLLICRSFPQRYLIEGLLVAAAQSHCLSEMVWMLLEVECPESVLRDMEVTLARLTSPADSWIAMRRVSWEIDRVHRASLFSADGRLVLSEWTNVNPGGGTATGLGQAQDRSRIWNVASALFNDRRTVEAKAERYEKRLEELAHISYPDALARVEVMESEGPVFNLLDGPQIQMLYGRGGPQSEFGVFQDMLRASAALGAARLVVALLRYRMGQGRYPAELAALAPEFVPTLPVDPFSGLPYRYHSDGGSSFLLYSWGRDGVDNGGHPPGSRQNPYFREDEELNVDEVYTSSRPRPLWEPEIEFIATNGSQ